MTRVFDSWRCVSLSLYMVLSGYAVLVAIPVISTAWATKLGFTEAQVGALAAADLGGLSMGAVACAVVVARVDRRLLVLGAISLAILANLGCLVVSAHSGVFALRLIAGLGSGVYTAVAVASLGAHSNPTRAYSWVLFAFACSQALELSLLPQLSMNGIYLTFAGSYALALPFLGWLPRRGPDPVAEGPTECRPRAPRFVTWLVLLAILFTYTNIGAYWTFIELASIDAGVSASWVGGVLVGSSLFSILGCVAAALVSERFELLRPLVWVLMAQASVVLVLVVGIDDATLLGSVFAFNFTWMFSDIFQLATLARVDTSGAFAALVPGAQGLGQIVGPTLAASLLASGFGYSGVFLICALASSCAVAVYIILSFVLARL